MKRIVLGFAAIVALVSVQSRAAEVMPPKPDHYFNDYAGIISKSAPEQFDRQLEQFERETSNQFVVAIFPKMQSDSDIADYTQRVAQSWKVGQKERRNGIVLFVFTEDQKMIVQVGYGLEGALPDASAFNITEYKIKPQFVVDDYEGGLRVGIGAICAAIRNEYNEKTETPEEQHDPRGILVPILFAALFIVLSLAAGIRTTSRRRGYNYSSSGRHWTIDWGNVIFAIVELLFSSSSTGSDDRSSSSGGFSGGGGSFGGGGAGSSW